MGYTTTYTAHDFSVLRLPWRTHKAWIKNRDGATVAIANESKKTALVFPKFRECPDVARLLKSLELEAE